MANCVVWRRRLPLLLLCSLRRRRVGAKQFICLFVAPRLAASAAPAADTCKLRDLQSIAWVGAAAKLAPNSAAAAAGMSAFAAQHCAAKQHNVAGAQNRVATKWPIDTHTHTQVSRRHSLASALFVAAPAARELQQRLRRNVCNRSLRKHKKVAAANLFSLPFDSAAARGGAHIIYWLCKWRRRQLCALARCRRRTFWSAATKTRSLAFASA